MQTFSFNTNPNKDLPFPLFPDFHPQSELSQKLIKVKQVNGPDFWPVTREVLAHDLKTLPLNRFKVWASVLNVPLVSMNKYSDYILLALTAAKNPVYRQALVDKGVGFSNQDVKAFYIFDDFPTTMNRAQIMSHYIINGWTPEKLSGISRIVELGGGIGDMCDIAYRLGFDGEYLIYDLPEVSELQKYYMRELGNTKAKFTSSLDDLGPADLVIATWSFTEMDLELRKEIMDKISESKNWLIAYSNKIFGIDNNDYIKNTFVPLVEENKDVKYTDIPFMPWDGGAHYLSVTEKVT